MRAVTLCLFVLFGLPAVAQAQTRLTAFRPSQHGLRFDNSFAHVRHGTIDVGVTKIAIGDAANGVCGGMIYAARDYFEAGCVRPPDGATPDSGVLYDYLVARLYDSFDLPGGPLAYLQLMNPALPDHESWLSSYFGLHGRAWLTINEQWPRIKQDLDNGRVSSMGLVMVKSSDPTKLGHNHQVLAYGYELTGTSLSIRVYDPNSPGDDNARVELDIGDPSRTTSMRLTNGAGWTRTVFAFFRTSYSHRAPPACGGGPARPNRTFSGDFDGDGAADVVRYVPDGHGWFLGRGQAASLSWTSVGNTRGFGRLATEPFWTGRFSQSAQSELLFYQPTDGNWYLGSFAHGTLTWTFAGNTSAAGNLMDGRHQIFTGDFDGDGRSDLLLYGAADGNWFLGTVSVTGVSWSFAGNTAGFGDLLDGQHRFFTGDFDGDGRSDVLFYYAVDGNWYLGAGAAVGLSWHFAGNTTAAGNLLDGQHDFHSGDFNGDGRSDVLLYSASNGDWFLGAGAAFSLSWTFAGNTAGFGNLMDGWHRIFVGDFDLSGRVDILFYYAGDGNWYLGAGAAVGLSWSFAGNTAGFGNLLDGRHEIFTGDHDNDGRIDLLIDSLDDGNWFKGNHTGHSLSWTHQGKQ